MSAPHRPEPPAVPRSSSPWLARSALAVAVAAAACGGAAPPPRSVESALLTKPLPEFSRRALDGSKVDTKELRGRVVVVKFFAKYCEPCKRTLPEVEALAKSHAEVAFVGIDEDEHASDVEELVSTYGLTFPVVHDSAQVLSGRFRVRELPATFVADAQGVVRWVGGEGQTGDDVERAIASTR